MSKKLNTEELVRSRLEDAELTPSEGAWNGIMRKFRWKQFLRFHPGRFNIYYAGILLLAGAGLAILLTRDEIVPEPIEAPSDSVTSAPEKETGGDAVTEILAIERVEERSKPTHKPVISEIVGEETVTKPDAESPIAVTDKDQGMAAENTLSLSTVSPLKSESPEEHLPFTYFTSSVQSGCAPMEVQFSNQSANATSYKWTFGTGDESDKKDPVYLFKEAGRFTVTLVAENHGGKASVSRRLIEVLPRPVAEFQIEEGLEGIDNHVVLNLLNYSSAGSAYSWCLTNDKEINCSQWSSHEFQPSITLNSISPDSKSVRLELVNEHGCRDTATLKLPLRVESSEVKIKFATAFSPNPSGPGDGSFSTQSKRIDLFHPIYMEVPVEYRMRVFTRRGELVFETREVYQGWSGYIHQEKAPGDVYVWMVEGKWADGQLFSYHGDVTLVWNQYW